MAAFTAALADGRLAQAIAHHFDQAAPPVLSVTQHGSFQQALWHVSLNWPVTDAALPTQLALKAHPGRFSVWEFGDRDLGAVERVAARAVALAGVQVPPAFDLTLGGYSFWALEWLAGHKPSSADDFSAIGKSLGALHAVGAWGQGPPAFTLHAFLDHLHNRLSACGEGAAAALALKVKGVLADAPPVLTHGDPHQGNWIIGKSGPPVLLDFEDAAFFPAARDLAVLHRAVDGDAFANVCSGYRAAGGVVAADLRSWRALLALQDFAIVAHIKSTRATSADLPPMDEENWMGLPAMSVDQIAAMVAE